MGDKPTDRVLINPFLAINIAAELSLKHKCFLTKQEWVLCQTEEIKRCGLEAWLFCLLDVLEGNYDESTCGAMIRKLKADALKDNA